MRGESEARRDESAGKVAEAKGAACGSAAVRISAASRAARRAIGSRWDQEAGFNRRRSDLKRRGPDFPTGFIVVKSGKISKIRGGFQSACEAVWEIPAVMIDTCGNIPSFALAPPAIATIKTASLCTANLHPNARRASAAQRRSVAGIVMQEPMEVVEQTHRPTGAGLFSAVPSLPKLTFRHEREHADELHERAAPRDLRIPAGLLLAIVLSAYLAGNWDSLTYLKLHVFLLLPEIWLRFTPASPLSWASAKTRKIGFFTTMPLAFAAIIFSSMWDSLIFSKGVFTFDQGSMLGVFGAMPLEEWLWFIDHTTLASIVTLAVMRPQADDVLAASLRSPLRQHSPADKGAAMGLAALSTTGFWLTSQILMAAPGADEHLLFLGVLMGFMPPVLALQWWFGGNVFRQRPGEMLSAIAAVSVYVLALDQLALSKGIWHLNPDYTTGLNLLGVSIEQILVYTLTTVLVVQTNVFVVRAAEAHAYLNRKGLLTGNWRIDLSRTLSKKL